MGSGSPGEISPSLKYRSHWPNKTRYHKYPPRTLSPHPSHLHLQRVSYFNYWHPYLARPGSLRANTNRSLLSDPSHIQISRDASPCIPTTDTDSSTSLNWGSDSINYFSTRHISIISSFSSREPGPAQQRVQFLRRFVITVPVEN